jgi:two-component system alkaline phosphatase synthesis response regulator PhoP
MRRWTFGVAIAGFVVAVLMLITLIVLWNVYIIADFRTIKELSRSVESLRISTPQHDAGARWAVLAMGSTFFTLILVALSLFFSSYLVNRRYRSFQTDWINMTTHELKLPIANVQLFAQTLQRPQLAEQDRERFTALVLQEVRRLDQLVSRLLQARRIEGRMQEMRLERVDPRRRADLPFPGWTDRHGQDRQVASGIGAGQPPAERVEVRRRLRTPAAHPADRRVDLGRRGRQGPGDPFQVPQARVPEVLPHPQQGAPTADGNGSGALHRQRLDGNAQGSHRGQGQSGREGQRVLVSTAGGAMSAHRLLLVEDDLPMAMGLEFNLKAEGFDVDHCPDGETGLEAALQGGYSLVVLDMRLPGISGLDVLLALRRKDVRTPVLILSATTSPESVVEGLERGADDYMTKPFDLDVLLARIRSLIRSREWLSGTSNPLQERNEVRVGERVVDFRSSSLSGPDGTMDLSFKEAMLLRRLVDNAGRTVTRDELLREVWGYTDGVQTRTIDNFVVALRKKVEPNPRKPRYIQTVPGEGYRFVPD